MSRLYCTNLPDKLRKHDLRLSLYTLFATYGTILDVVAMKTERMRGQAHVVFKDVQASTQAMRALQGFDFFGKEMVREILLHSNLLYLSTHWGFRELSMPRALRMSSRDSAAPIVYQYKGPGRALVRPPTFRDRFSVDVRLQQNCHPDREVPMVRRRQLTVSNVPGRKEAMRKKHQWTKRVMCQWRLHRMRINLLWPIQGTLRPVGR